MHPPSWRPDLTDKWTLAEEVARIEGYDRIPSVLPHAAVGPRADRRAAGPPSRRATRSPPPAIVETPSFPFTTEEQNDLHGSASGGHLPSVKLANPLDGQAPFLRRSLVPGLLQVAHRNVVARLHRPRAVRDRHRLPARSPASRTAPRSCRRSRCDRMPRPSPRWTRRSRRSTGTSRCCSPGRSRRQAARAGRPSRPDLADALDAVRTIAAAAGVTIEVAQGERAALHPGRTGVLSVGATEVGYVGELLPAVAEAADLPGRVVVAELDLDLVLSLAGEKVVAASLSGFPAATQDVSLVRRRRRPRCGGARGARRRRRASCSSRCASSTTTAAPGVPDGAKSLTFALRFRAPDRTLTAAEATEAKLAGVAAAAERFGATLRE